MKNFIYIIPLLCVIVLCCHGGTEQYKSEIAFVAEDSALQTYFREAKSKAVVSELDPSVFISEKQMDLGGMSLMDAFSVVPQEDSNYCGAVLNTLLEDIIGIRQGSDDASMGIFPMMPKEYGYIGVKGLIVGNHVVDVVHLDNRTTEVKNVSGVGHIKCLVGYVGEYRYISMGETMFAATNCIVDGKRISMVSISIPVGSTVTLRAVNL